MGRPAFVHHSRWRRALQLGVRSSEFGQAATAAAGGVATGAFSRDASEMFGETTKRFFDLFVCFVCLFCVEFWFFLRYNRANYLFDAGLRFSRYTSGYNFAMAQAGPAWQQTGILLRQFRAQGHVLQDMKHCFDCRTSTWLSAQCTLKRARREPHTHTQVALPEIGC